MNERTQIDRARPVRIEDELARRGYPFWTKRRHSNLGQPCPMCGGTDRFSVNTKKQVFFCRPGAGCGAAGDVIALVQALDRVSFLDAIAYLTDGKSTSPNSRKQQEQAAKQRDEEADRQRRINAARLNWARSRPIAGTIADRYLRFRGIAIDEDLSHCIGFDPEAGWRGVADDPASPILHVPCILAAFRSIETDELVAVLKTRLNPDGSKHGRRFNGCSKGAVCKIDPDENATMGLSLAEGLETALSARLVGFRPIWATGGTGTLENFPVLAGVESLTFQRENDTNQANCRAVDACAERWLAAGRQVFDASPPDDCNDINDALQKRIARA
ncbi:MAG: toprim domain-containing protein [Methylocella sp.]